MEAVANYQEQALRIMKRAIPFLGETELRAAIAWSVKNRLRDTPAKVYNDYKNKTAETSVAELTQYILSKRPIMTSYGVLFSQHDTIPNPLKRQIEYYIERRSKLKKEMFKYTVGSEMYERYNLAQQLMKLQANSEYGANGSPSSFFFNLHVAASITRQGRSSISAAVLLFEAFLVNNVLYQSLDDILVWIDNVIQERPNRHYRDEDIINKYPTVEQVFYKIMTTCGFNGYIPTEEDCNTVWTTLCQCDKENLTRLYYKNNLYEFCENDSVQRAILFTLESMEVPFLDPNDPQDEILPALNGLLDLFREYVYYGHMYSDKIERCALMFKKVSILTDTDSSIITLDAWYRYILSKVYDKNIKIKVQFINKDKFLKDLQLEIADEENVRNTQVYDFFTDEFVEVQRAIYPDKIIPQDNLRYSIINIMVYILSKLSTEYMQVYSANYNSHADKNCCLILKNELLIRRMVIMEQAKKHYAAYIEMQEGKLVPENKRLKVVGMEMDKMSLQADIKAKLGEVLTKDILEPQEIDHMQIISDVIRIEKDIYESLASGDTKYYKPTSIKSITSYTDPMKIQGVKGAIVYNATKDESAEALNLESRNGINIVKTKINMDNIQPLKKTNPRIYQALANLLEQTEFKNGISAISIPHGVETPKWVLDYIDYYTIINDNIKVFPFEAVGLVGKAGNESVNHSNILKIG